MKLVPNILTICRLLLVPVIILMFQKEWQMAALSVFILACATDVLDGYIARKTNSETALGRALDPLADKMMTVTVLICLSLREMIPWIIALFYVVKEAILVIGFFVVFFRKEKGVIYKSKPLGKVAMCFTFCGISLSFFESAHIFSGIVMWIAVGVNIASAAFYYIHCYKKKPI